MREKGIYIKLALPDLKLIEILIFSLVEPQWQQILSWSIYVFSELTIPCSMTSWLLPGFLASLVRVSIPAQTSRLRSKLGRKGFIRLILPYCCSSPRKSGLELKQVRKQELMQRPRRDVPYWLASPGLLSLLSYRTKTTSPEMVPPTRGLSSLLTN